MSSEPLRPTACKALLCPAMWLFAALVFAGCVETGRQTGYYRAGETYGVVSGTFRHRWWNYYERGLSFAEGAYYREAISDLQQAIRRRGEDQRMARTYGMHFVDYFPHRELGIVYLQSNDLEKAAYHLERSIEQWPTAKARFYLDRVREQRIQQRGEAVAPPKIRIENAAAEVWTRSDPVVIAGTITDENYVASVRIGERDLFLDGARTIFPFSETLKLSQGAHRIAVAAKNLGDESARVELLIHVDREGPVITVEEAAAMDRVAGKFLRLRGSVYDPAGIESLRIDGKKWNAAGKMEIFFDETVLFAKQALKMAATDTLKNQTAAEFNPQSTLTRVKPPVWLAGKDRLLPGLIGFFGPADKQAPGIALKGWKPTQVVYVESIYLEGSAVDESEIVRLTINGANVRRRNGRMIAFGRLVRLSEGSNRFVVEAEDRHGNSAKVDIEVVRKIPEALKLEQRLSLTVVPFEQHGAVSDFGLSFQDHLTDALVSRNRFKLVERRLLESILQEQKLSQTALVEQSTAVKVGRLSAAHSIVTGSIVESRIGVEAVARLVDVESSEILITEDVYGESRDFESMQKLAQILAIKIHRRFPLVNGIVLGKKGNVIFTDLGEEQIGCQKRLIIYRDHPIRHPLNDRIVGSDMEILSHARVRQVSAEMTKAELVDPLKKDVTEFDKVITQ